MTTTVHHVAHGECEADCGLELRRLSMGGGEVSSDWDDVTCAGCLEYNEDEHPTTDAGPEELQLGEEERRVA